MAQSTPHFASAGATDPGGAPDPPQRPALIGFLLLTVVSIFWSDYPSATVVGWAATFSVAFFAIFLATVLDLETMLRALGVALRWILALSLAFEADAGGPEPASCLIAAERVEIIRGTEPFSSWSERVGHGLVTVRRVAAGNPVQVRQPRDA